MKICRDKVTELTQYLAEQDIRIHEVEGHDSNSSFENPYHNCTRVWEHLPELVRYGPKVLLFG